MKPLRILLRFAGKCSPSAKVRLILLDMTIPGASSHEVAALAAQVRPDLKVVLTSAYGEEIARTTTSAMQ
ncbi:MAG TPA: hypothetical protein VF753_17320, partial [Terriglobales bacterium]